MIKRAECDDPADGVLPTLRHHEAVEPDALEPRAGVVRSVTRSRSPGGHPACQGAVVPALEPSCRGGATRFCAGRSAGPVP